MPTLITIPIALALAGGASAGAGIYATRRAGQVNDRAIQAQRDEARENAALERERTTSQERMYLQALEADRQRWNDYSRIMSPHWQTGTSALGQLHGMAGMGGAPTSTMPVQGGQPSTGTGPGMSALPPSNTQPPAYVNTLPTGGRTAARRAQATATPMEMPGMGNSLSSLGQLLAMAQMAGGSGGRLPLLPMNAIG